MNIILFLIVGILAGWIAGLIMEGHGLGILGDMIVGIIGAFLGGFIFSAIGVSTVGFWGSVAMSAVGAIVFLFIVNLFSRGRARPLGKLVLLPALFAMSMSSFVPVRAHAEESTVNKVKDTAGDTKTDTKKAWRKGKRKARKAMGTDTMGKDIKDKANDVGDDTSNAVNKAERKTEPQD